MFENIKNKVYNFAGIENIDRKNELKRLGLLKLELEREKAQVLKFREDNEIDNVTYDKKSNVYRLIEINDSYQRIDDLLDKIYDEEEKIRK